MHSRIFQLKTEPLTDENRHDLLTADDFLQNSSFIGPIADYTSDDCSRHEDYGWLVGHLANAVAYSHSKSYGAIGAAWHACHFAQKTGFQHAEYFEFHYAEDGAEMPEAYILFKPGFKTAYFQKQYDEFVKMTGKMTPDDFASEAYMQDLVDAVSDKFGFYVAHDAFDVKPLDNFLRSLPNDEIAKYYLWATVDYHC